jgi:small subunit ribosomal protein S4e
MYNLSPSAPPLSGQSLTLRLSNIFVIGEGAKAQVSLPKGKGVKLSIAEERDQRRRARAQEA